MSTALQSPTSSRKKLRPSDTLVRAAVSELLRLAQPLKLGGSLEPITDVISRRYETCPATLAYVQRAAVSPASTTVATWAAELVQSSIADFLSGPTGTSSAFASLQAKAMNLVLPPGTAVIKIPSRSTPATLVGSWIGESSAKPVSIIPLATSSLASYKLAAISMFTEELLLHSTPSIEAVVTSVLRNDLSNLLDSALLDSTASSATRPAGLFNGATAVTASAATPATSAMVADLKALTAAVAGTVNPSANVVFVVNPAQAISINTFALQPIDNLIVSSFMAAGSVGALDVDAIAMTASQPAFAQSRSAALHADSVPLPLATSGPVVASPMRSTFQEDTIALRSVLRAGWVKCRASATAIVSGATW